MILGTVQPVGAAVLKHFSADTALPDKPLWKVGIDPALLVVIFSSADSHFHKIIARKTPENIDIPQNMADIAVIADQKI